MLNQEIIKELEKEQMKEEVPTFNIGDEVEVGILIKEGERERVQKFVGTVMKRQNGGVRETFTVRKISYGVGVEKTLPLHSPKVADIKVLRRGKVRRAKINYLNKRLGKSARVKEKK